MTDDTSSLPEPAPDASTGAERSATGLTPGMKRVLWGVGGIVVIVLALAVWFTLVVVGEDSAAPTTTSTPSAGPGPLPGATPTTGSEVQTPGSTAPPQDRIPDRTSAGPLVAAPLPDSAAETGELVTGFPSEAMGPAADSDVVSSAIASDGAAMQVTLVARTDAAAADVIAHYRQLWTGLNLTDQGATDPNVVSFAGRQATLTLAFSGESATGTVYNILATFRAE